MMLGRYVPRDYHAPVKELVYPVPDDYFIYWLFKYTCIMCMKSATEINEIIPRSRSKKSIRDWHNRIPLCRGCHNDYHKDGVTEEKLSNMQKRRRVFLANIGRSEYV